MAGMNPMAFMMSKHPGHRFAMVSVAAAARRARELEARELAVLIANKVGEMLSGGG